MHLNFSTLSGLFVKILVKISIVELRIVAIQFVTSGCFELDSHILVAKSIQTQLVVVVSWGIIHTRSCNELCLTTRVPRPATMGTFWADLMYNSVVSKFCRCYRSVDSENHHFLL